MLGARAKDRLGDECSAIKALPTEPTSLITLTVFKRCRYLYFRIQHQLASAAIVLPGRLSKDNSSERHSIYERTTLGVRIFLAPPNCSASPISDCCEHQVVVFAAAHVTY